MGIAARLNELPIVQNFSSLKGNTRTTVLFEIIYGITNVFYSFYLSLYMKEQGITDTQIGYIISIGFVSCLILAPFGGLVTNKLGRKKTTTIFEIVAWPGSIVLYLLAQNFWMFALARVVNSFNQFSTVAWNMMVVEDADDTQRINAYNLLVIIQTATGIITPIGSIFVVAYGLIRAEKIFLIFAAVCMCTGMLIRNHFFTETKNGEKILKENKSIGLKDALKSVLQKDVVAEVVKTPPILMVVIVYVIYRMYYAIGSHLSLYFAVYLTGVLKIDQSLISIIGGINSFALLLVCVFVTPTISRKLRNKAMTAKMLAVGFLLQIAYAVLMVVIPAGSLLLACVAIVIYAVGFGIAKVYSDSMLAASTEAIVMDRAGVYSLVNTAISFSSIVMGSISGFLYVINPHLIYIITIGLLTINVVVLLVYSRMPVNMKEETSG